MTADEALPRPAPGAGTVTGSGTASADHGGIANTGIIIGDARSEHHEHHHYPPTAPVWPILVGQPPALASAFQPRRGLREQVLAARHRGDDVVLAHHDVRRDVGTRVLAGGGGVGKSQLAAWFARQAVEEHTADLVVWVNATGPDQVTTVYARAAVRAGVPGATGADPTVDAAALLEWLHVTDRTWLVVLDDVTDPAQLTGWWPPHRSTGWTLATTRLRDATLISSGRQQIDVDVYTPDEAITYLTDRLTDAGRAHLLDDRTADLAAAVGHLPLALSHVAAFMISQEEPCAVYLARYSTGDGRLSELMPAGADPDAYGRPVAVTLLLALDAADTAEPVGLARPALALAAVCDPAGHPDALWATAPVTGYLTGHRVGSRPPSGWMARLRHPRREDRSRQAVTADQAYQALRLLHRYGLLTHTPTDGARAVRIHALTARAAQETTADPAAVAGTAADALLALWPDNGHTTADLVAALRANTTTLVDTTADLLWHPRVHPLLHTAGNSLLDAGLHTSAITYWQHMTEQAGRVLGAEHPDALVSRINLAYAYRQAGRTAGAITFGEQLVADCIRVLGAEHPNTLTSRSTLAGLYWQAGRTAEAITIEEQVVLDTVRVLGAEHPDTLTSRNNLAVAYWQAGRTAEAIAIEEQVVVDRARVLGAEHPDTLASRNNLAVSYGQAGRTAEAITFGEQVIGDCERVLGAEHPDTLVLRSNLAASYGQAGRIAEAITVGERAVADCVRVLSAEHPNTLAAHSNLANAYRQAGRTAEAITLEEQLLVDTVRVLGADHPNTLVLRSNSVSSYRQAGRTAEAITLGEQVIADCVRVFGAEHATTLATCGALANAYREAGRTAEAITLLEQVVTDSLRVLGADHPHTVAARSNLANAHGQGKRTAEAVTLGEQAVADCVRVLGAEHPDTLVSRANLANAYRQAGRTAEAVTLGEQAFADCVRVFGAEHPETLACGSALANAYRRAGRTAEAITLLEQVITGVVRLFGAEHPNTLNSRGDLAYAYRWAGRTAEAITLLEQVAADLGRVFGAEHPNTAAATRALGVWRAEANEPGG